MKIIDLSDNEQWGDKDIYNRLNELKAHSELKDCEELDISYTLACDLQSIFKDCKSSFKNLKRLFLQATNIKDISFLINLKKLSFSGTQVQDISTLKTLTNLEELSIGGTKVSYDLSAIAGLVKLRELYLTNLDIDGSSLLCLKSLRNLQILSVDENLFAVKQQVLLSIQKIRETAQKQKTETKVSVSPSTSFAASSIRFPKFFKKTIASTTTCDTTKVSFGAM